MSRRPASGATYGSSNLTPIPRPEGGIGSADMDPKTATSSPIVAVNQPSTLMSQQPAVFTQRSPSSRREMLSLASQLDPRSRLEVGMGCGSGEPFRTLEEEVVRLHAALASVIVQLEEQSRNTEELPAYGQ